MNSIMTHKLLWIVFPICWTFEIKHTLVNCLKILGPISLGWVHISQLKWFHSVKRNITNNKVAISAC